jgi:hypothetical protein
MADMSTLVTKAEQLSLLTREAIVQAAWGLDTQAAERAGRSSFDELAGRIERAIEEMQGKRSQLSIAEEILDSYRFEEHQVSFTVPAGSSDADVEALKALNEYSWKRHNRDAVLRGDLWKLQELPERYPSLCARRESGESRKVYLYHSSNAYVREGHQTAAEESNLQIADARDIALACAIHRLAYSGGSLIYSMFCSAITHIPELVVAERESGELYLNKHVAGKTYWGFYAPSSRA